MRASNASTRRSGFTLVEVLVALALSGLVLLGARAAASAVADNADRIARSARVSDAAANAEHVARALVAQTEVGTPGTAPFAGTGTNVSFGSWCSTPGGWSESCDVTLAVTPDSIVAPASPSRDRLTIVVRTSRGDDFTLRSELRRAGFLYLASAGNGGTWHRTWGPGSTAPLAIGLVVDGDTLVYRIGARG